MNVQHIGIYAVILRNNSILLVEKSRGPYTGLLDLPGGKIEHGETLDQALRRELLEETGITIDNYELFTNISHTVQFTHEQQMIAMHHIGLIYKILSFNHNHKPKPYEDVRGYTWLPIQGTALEQLTPFAIFIIKTLKCCE